MFTGTMIEIERAETEHELRRLVLKWLNVSSAKTRVFVWPQERAVYLVFHSQTHIDHHLVPAYGYLRGGDDGKAA